MNKSASLQKEVTLEHSCLCWQLKDQFTQNQKNTFPLPVVLFHLDSLGVIIRQVLEISAVKLLPSLENNFIVVLKVRYHFLSVSRFSVSSFTLEIFVFEAS